MMQEFARLLYDRIGLDPSSIGLSSIERAVQLRMRTREIASAPRYLQELRDSSDEVQALIEAVVVPETWFFRDPKAFAVVAETARTAPPGTKLHFLCIPCSTGEEPYSLAMALLDAGVSPDRFHIDAVDVSERVLVHARRGHYGRNSFRGRELEFRDRYFEATPDGHVLSPAVRNLVQFHRGNLIEDTTLTRGKIYDAVFCRNLLIYFDSETQLRAIRALERILAPNGLFCLGPAETGLLADFEFTHTQISLAFAFRKGRTRPAAVAPARARSAPMRATGLPIKPRQEVKPAAVRPAELILIKPALDLTAAIQLADAGRLAEVVAICQAAIKQSGASADAHYLLGLVSDSEGRPDEAADHYRKALYLDPQHHDALLHFSLLTAKRGDTAAAQMLRDRARRCTIQAA